MTIENILLVITGTLTSLLSGLFFGYAVSVNLGLHRLKDVEYIKAMQSINIVILNPIFFLSFMGPVFLLPLVTFLSRADSTLFSLLLTSSIIYIFGSFGVTAAGNVPLNEKLAKLDIKHASDEEIATLRKNYEAPWNRLHIIRTIASIIATVFIFIACLAK